MVVWWVSGWVAIGDPKGAPMVDRGPERGSDGRGDPKGAPHMWHHTTASCETCSKHGMTTSHETCLRHAQKHGTTTSHETCFISHGLLIQAHLSFYILSYNYQSKQPEPHTHTYVHMLRFMFQAQEGSELLARVI